MEARPPDGRDRVEPFVEDPGRDADERRSQPRSARGADRQRDALVVESEARRHHALHPLAGLERLEDEVDLAEHAVQLQVEAGQEVARAEPEARRQDARVPVGVGGDEIRRVALGARPVERGEQRVHARGGVELPQPWQARERLGDAGEPAAGEEPVPCPADLGRPLPAVLVALQVGPRHRDPLDA